MWRRSEGEARALAEQQTLLSQQALLGDGAATDGDEGRMDEDEEDEDDEGMHGAIMRRALTAWCEARGGR